MNAKYWEKENSENKNFNLPDQMQRCLKLIGDRIICFVVQTDKDLTALVLYTDHQIKTLYSCSVDNDAIIEINRTFNLKSYFLRMMTFKNLKLFKLFGLVL